MLSEGVGLVPKVKGQRCRGRLLPELLVRGWAALGTVSSLFLQPKDHQGMQEWH